CASGARPCTAPPRCVRGQAVATPSWLRRPAGWPATPAGSPAPGSHRAAPSANVAQARVVVLRAAGNQTGRSARLCRSARPRTCPGMYRRSPSGLQPAVELRLGEKSARQLQDLIGPAQLLVLAFELLHALGVRAGDAVSYPGIDLVPLHPRQQRLRHTADLGSDRLDRGPQRRILATMLLHHPDGPLTHLWGKLLRPCHGSILSRVGASTNPGAIPRSGIYL